MAASAPPTALLALLIIPAYSALSRLVCRKAGEDSDDDGDEEAVVVAGVEELDTNGRHVHFRKPTAAQTEPSPYAQHEANRMDIEMPTIRTQLSPGPASASALAHSRGGNQGDAGLGAGAGAGTGSDSFGFSPTNTASQRARRASKRRRGRAMLSRMRGRRVSRHTAWSAYLCALVVVLYLLYPTVTKEVVKLLDCSAEIDGVRYVEHDYSVDCGTSTYDFFSGIAIILVAAFCAGLPFFSLAALALDRRSAHARRALGKKARRQAASLVFLTQGFKPRWYFWECGTSTLCQHAAVVVCSRWSRLPPLCTQSCSSASSSLSLLLCE